MKHHLIPHVDILAWCLMPNHFHWLIQVKQEYQNLTKTENKDKKVDPLNRSIGTLQSSYTQAMNRKYNRSGSLFRAKTKAKSLSEDRTKQNYYGLNCFFYIHQNPLRAGLIDKMEDWPFSSFRDYAGIRNGHLCNQKLAADLFKLPNDPEKFYQISNKTIPLNTIQKLY
jgi:REP element-mobilizing transposase RayT